MKIFSAVLELCHVYSVTDGANLVAGRHRDSETWIDQIIKLHFI